MTRVRVGFGCGFELGGLLYKAGDELDLADDVAGNLLRAGLVLPVDDGRPVEATGASVCLPGPAPAPESKGSENGTQTPTEGPCNACETPQRKAGKALSVCKTPGCSCLVKSGACPGCRKAYDRRRNATAHRKAYSKPSWRRTRKAYLRENPYCECDDCAELPEIMRPMASVVDHIDGLGPLGPRGHDWDNLMAMTKEHHDARTMRDQVRGDSG